MTDFEEKLHPKYGLKVRFTYKFRAIDYLTYFKIIIIYRMNKFVPLDLNFESYEELIQFLYNRGVLYDETEIDYMDTSIKAEATIVDTKQIYGIEESIERYLLNYKYYSINEIAELLSFSRPTIYKLVDEKTLNAVRIHGQLRINHLDLMAFIHKQNQQ